MPERRIEFDDPPVIETVLSLQFAPLEGFTAAHVGMFFHGWLKIRLPEWAEAKFAGTLAVDEVAEKFGSEIEFGRMGLKFGSAEEPNRIQITRPGSERMIQIQNTRIIYNWRKGDGTYPSYTQLRPEFDKIVHIFSAFLKDVGLPTIALNLWEVIYINHVPKGPLWSSISDWPSILPGLYVPKGQPNESISLETMNSGWRYSLNKDHGRLHLTLQHGRADKKGEVMILQLLARGPIDVERNLTAETGFSLGHSVIINTFAQMTSNKAHMEWKAK